jgi:hypothetical protein
MNFIDPPDPPTGVYWCVSDDPEFLSWVGDITFATIQYCPGIGVCQHGAYNPAIEVLRLSLQSIQSSKGWEDIFVINPMHIGSNVVGSPHHLLTVGPFMDEDLQPMGERMHNAITERGFATHLYAYNRL